MELVIEETQIIVNGFSRALVGRGQSLADVAEGCWYSLPNPDIKTISIRVVPQTLADFLTATGFQVNAFAERTYFRLNFSFKKEQKL